MHAVTIKQPLALKNPELISFRVFKSDAFIVLQIGIDLFFLLWN